LGSRLVYKKNAVLKRENERGPFGKERHRRGVETLPQEGGSMIKLRSLKKKVLGKTGAVAVDADLEHGRRRIGDMIKSSPDLNHGVRKKGQHPAPAFSHLKFARGVAVTMT